MNRREFLGAAALAAMGTMQGNADISALLANTLPKLNGKEFQGMEGAFAPLFTPYTADGKINTPMVGKMVEFLLGRGIKGFYVCGGTGEHILLSLAERKRMAEAVIEANKGRTKVVVHVGCTATKDSVELARHAEKVGADWISSLGPIVFGQTFEASYKHYERIANATALPMMIYCWYRDLVPDRERKFYDIPNLKGMKYTGRDFGSVQEMKRMIDKEAIFFVGDDPHLLSGLTMNKVFSGGIGTTYNMIPKHFVDICRLAKEGRFTEAMPIQAEANHVTFAIAADGNFSYRKAVMRYLGFDCGPARSPFGFPLSEEEYSAFAKELDALQALRESCV